MKSDTSPPRPEQLAIPGFPNQVETILFMSDVHIGAKISSVADEKRWLEQAGKYDHVVLAGDIFEMFYISRTRTGIPNKSQLVEQHVEQSLALLGHFLETHPHCKVHYVMGNHDNVDIFRNGLDDLQRKYANFEWDPQGIQIGDALITHGDLPIRRQTDETRHISTVREVTAQLRQAKVHELLEYPGQGVVDHVRRPKSAARIVHDQLAEWAKKGAFAYQHAGKTERLDSDWNRRIRHVFFGHTHVNFTRGQEIDGVQYHNTGSLTSIKETHPGPLQAELINGVGSGYIDNLRPVPKGLFRGVLNSEMAMG